MEPQIAPVRNRPYEHQLKVLVSYMEAHSEFAKGHVTKLGASGSDKHHEMWMGLTKLLNDSGSTSKTTAGWQRTWAHLRLTAKNKKAAFTVAMNKTGNAETLPPLRDLDIQISNIFGKYGTGLCIVREVGVLRKAKSQPEIEQLGIDVSSDDEIHSQFSQSGAFNVPEFSLRKCEAETARIMADLARCVIESLRFIEANVKNRPKKNQMQKLVEYMDQNILFANGGSSDAVAEIKWTDLTDQLNARGPPIRTKAVWQRTWTDLKQSVVKRAEAIRDGTRKTPLTATDLLVYDIIEKGQAPKRERSRSPLQRIKRDPATIDLTEDCEQTKAGGKAHKSVVSQSSTPRPPTKENLMKAPPTQRLNQSATPATATGGARMPSAAKSGANTSAVLDAMNRQSETYTEIGEKIVSCFEVQNRILKDGFRRIGEMIVEAIRNSLSIGDAADSAAVGLDAEKLEAPDEEAPYKVDDAEPLATYALDYEFDADDEFDSQLEFTDVGCNEDYLEENPDGAYQE